MSRTLNYEKILRGFRDESRLRTIPSDRSESDVLDLCSNDYMGLRHVMPEMRKEFDARFPDVSFSSSASRLLSVDQNIHRQLEDRLAELYGRPALLFNSGYHANTGIVSSLNIPGTLFVADKLVHASMIDGLTQGRCNFKRFAHNDIHALSTILEREAANYSQIVVMVESIYSMDGDMAPLREIAALRDRYDNVLLYVDEAHAFGVRGRQGLGLCEELGLMYKADIIMGTLGKAACSSGAFCVVSPELKAYFINAARSFIFSTALPPANIAWSLITIDRLVGMEAERKHLRDISGRVHEDLGTPGCDTPIVPFYTYDAAKAIRKSKALEAKGILALPIRRPTVPAGTERLRISLNASLSDADIDKLLNILAE